MQECYSGPDTADTGGCQFEWDLEQERPWHQIPCYSSSTSVTQMIQHIILCWTFQWWKKIQCGYHGRHQRKNHRSLGFWSKAMSSLPENYICFKKQLLACCWALVELKCLTINNQGTYWQWKIHRRSPMNMKPTDYVHHQQDGNLLVYV